MEKTKEERKEERKEGEEGREERRKEERREGILRQVRGISMDQRKTKKGTK